jgi:hypothetical protein
MPVADKEFMSFEDALKELRLKEEELKRLVSEGEIRAFREGETMKLRKSDVQNLRGELSGGEVVDLGGAGEELVFEDDSDLDAGMATEEIAQADTILEEDVEDVGVEVGTATRGRAARRPAPVREPEEEQAEGMAFRIALILTSVLLIATTPIMISIATGHVGDMAKGIAGIFAQFNS